MTLPKCASESIHPWRSTSALDWRMHSQLNADFPIILLATNVTLADAPSLRAAAVALCGANITVEEKAQVTTSGLGCAGSQGRGSVPNAQVGGGAGHGGVGGYGYVDEMTKTPGGSPYDFNVSYPCSPGSGGGSSPTSSDGGAGGGVIFVSAVDTFAHLGTLVASGYDAVTGAGGGGSGGTIAISAGIMRGTGGLIRVRGGAGFNGGGGGSGGVVHVQWLRPDGAERSQQLGLPQLDVSGGAGGVVKSSDNPVFKSSSPSYYSSSASPAWYAPPIDPTRRLRYRDIATKDYNTGYYSDNAYHVNGNDQGDQGDRDIVNEASGGKGSFGYTSVVPRCPTGTAGLLCSDCQPGRYLSLRFIHTSPLNLSLISNPFLFVLFLFNMLIVLPSVYVI